jgi:predicted DNA-binding transcriptional regulator AlpA
VSKQKKTSSDRVAGRVAAEVGKELKQAIAGIDLIRATLDAERLREMLNAEEAAEVAGVAKRSWWRYVSSGKAPAPVRLGGSVRWRRSELAEWIAAGCPRVRKQVER